jgi:hypothetical protein
MRGNQRHALYIPQPSSRQDKSYGENEDLLANLRISPITTRGRM